MTTLATITPCNRLISFHLHPEYPREGEGGRGENKIRTDDEQTETSSCDCTAYFAAPPMCRTVICRMRALGGCEQAKTIVSATSHGSIM